MNKQSKLMLMLCILFVANNSFANPDCSKNNFEYSLSRTSTPPASKEDPNSDPRNPPISDFVISYTNQQGVKREILDDDGLLTVMALYRSWQTRNTAIIPTFDSLLLKQALLKFKRYQTKTIEAVKSDPANAGKLAEIEKKEQEFLAKLAAIEKASRAKNPQSFDGLKNEIQDLMTSHYAPNFNGNPDAFGPRHYSVSSSDGTKSSLIMCAHSGVRANCSDQTQRAVTPECGVWEDFCGVSNEDRNGDNTNFSSSWIKLPVASCHPVSLGEQIYGPKPSGSSSSDSKGSAQ